MPVTSTDIRGATGLCAKTLVRWAGQGIIPRPKVGPHPSGRGKIGYWDEWVLERCRELVKLQKQGRSLQAAVVLLGGRVDGQAGPIDGSKLEALAHGWRIIVEALGYDAQSPHFKESPHRVSRFLAQWHTSGPEAKPPPLTCFPNDNPRYDQIVLVRDIRYYSMCAHHGLPFFGNAHVAYLPKEKIVGLSKLARVVDFFARRFQTQEAITTQVAAYLEANLAPLGVGVVLTGEHLCMAMRGIERPGHSTITSEMRGVFRDKPEARAELLALLRGKE